MDKEELLITYLKKYKKKVDCELLTFIGQGSMGVAYKNEKKF